MGMLFGALSTNLPQMYFLSATGQRSQGFGAFGMPHWYFKFTASSSESTKTQFICIAWVLHGALQYFHCPGWASWVLRVLVRATLQGDPKYWVVQSVFVAGRNSFLGINVGLTLAQSAV